ncbi:unnamed protein product [Auanema sp. JU1783]|nr:unnamed protein product [Auanema sp. JU1783]
MLKLLLIACTFSLVSAQLLSGDYSQPATQSQTKGLKQNGYSAVVLRAAGPISTFDTNLCHNALDALNAGLTTMIYVTPDPTKDPADLVTKLNDGLMRCGLTYHKWWLQVVRPDHWSATAADNVKFIEAVIAKAKESKQLVGIYTSEGEWKKIVGDDYDINNTAVPEDFNPLWYWSNSTVKNFDDFKPFSGWNGPLMKQFQQGVTDQGIRLNRNIYASIFH